MKARRRSRLATLVLVAGRAAAQPSPTGPTAAPTYWTPAPFAAPPDDYDRDTFDHDPGTCGNYAPNEVYTGDALGLKGTYAMDSEANDCCYEYVMNDCTHNPTGSPTLVPTALPTSVPTAAPSKFKPSSEPTEMPTSNPSTMPTTAPTKVPSSIPSSIPTSVPSSFPTEIPISAPSPAPSFSRYPTSDPTT